MDRTCPERKENSQHFDFKFVKRFCRLLPWLFPSWKSRPALLFLLLLCLGLLEQYVVYNIGMVPSKFYKVLGDKDSSGFFEQTILAIALIVAEAFIKSTTTYVTSFLYLLWRDTISRRLHSKYFKDILCYAINVIDRTVDNPDQRITQDVNHFCNILSQLVAPVIISPFTIGYYLYQAQTRSGYIGPVSVFVFFVIATVINKILMSPIVKYFFLREKMEGNFRFKHMQIRSNSESIAFFHSGKLENERTNRHLKNLIDTQQKLILREYALNFSINLFDYLGSILSYLSIGIPILAGVYDHLSAPDLSALISANAFVVIYLINCFTKLIDLSDMATKVAGTTHRIVELIELLGILKAKQIEERTNQLASQLANSCGDSSQGGQESGWNEILSPDRKALVDFASVKVETNGATCAKQGTGLAFQVTGLTYVAPKAKTPLCKDLTFRFEAGTNILLTGQSGCGKSSLLRVIAGIWPEVRGCVQQIVERKPYLLLILPQKPYFTDGSLRQQIIYPLREYDLANRPILMDDDAVLDYLKQVGLGHLEGRCGGLDVDLEWNWYDELSPGEMQRLSFVRLFFHCPKFAVLDEATSQIGQDLERELYSLCHQLGITVLSVGHRDSLRQYHHTELHLQGDGGWTLTPIIDSEA